MPSNDVGVDWPDAPGVWMRDGVVYLVYRDWKGLRAIHQKNDGSLDIPINHDDLQEYRGRWLRCLVTPITSTSPETQ